MLAFVIPDVVGYAVLVFVVFAVLGYAVYQTGFSAGLEQEHKRSQNSYFEGREWMANQLYRQAMKYGHGHWSDEVPPVFKWVGEPEPDDDGDDDDE